MGKMDFNCSVKNESEAAWQLMAGILVLFIGQCISKGSVEQVGLITEEHRSSISGFVLKQKEEFG